MVIDNFNCEVCNGVLLEQTVWYDDKIGYITYQVCSNCSHILVDDKYRDRIMMIEETYRKDEY